jgi:hypothetical protein
VTRLDNLHASIADWFVQRGGKLDVVNSSDVELTEITTGSWTVFIGPDTWDDDEYDMQTDSLEVAILIESSIDESRYDEGEISSLVEEMEKQIDDDSVTLMLNYPDGKALWLARSIFVEENEAEILGPILENLNSWADVAYTKFATWPNVPRFKLIADEDLS